MGLPWEWTEGWAKAFSDGRITNPEYIDAGDTVIARFTVVGTNDGPFGSMKPTRGKMSLPFCEICHFDKWHRHRMVQARTRIMNQLQAVALNEGVRSKKRLWRDAGRAQLEAFALAPWASRRRRDLLDLLDRLTPTIAELTQAIEQEMEKCPEAQRLQTHPGVGALTALAFVLIIGKAERFQCGKQVASYLGLVPLEDSSGNRRRGPHHETR